MKFGKFEIDGFMLFLITLVVAGACKILAESTAVVELVRTFGGNGG
jgi:hypothetical protein